jgi:uncharacterized 2Fe-2S/4Fe-4S cluster protein (DUF4445 family)
MPTIVFMPWGKKVESDDHLSLLQLARTMNLPLQSTCGGKKICGKCKVVVEEAEGPLPQPSARERETLGGLIERGYRLACDTVLTSGAVVRIPEESLLRRQVVLTSGTEHPYPVRLRPKVGHYYVEVPAPILDPVVADRERLLLALTTTYGIKRPALDPFVLQRLPGSLRSGHKGVTATVWGKKEIIDLRAGKHNRLFGMAFDVGTTTVVGYLMDLETGEKLSIKSAMNPQISFGDDVISRISFCQTEPGGLEKMRSSIVQCLNDLIGEAAAAAGIDASEIMEVAVVGNTVMHHLLLGLDPRYLSMAPYAPVMQVGQDVKARDLGMEIGNSAYVHLLPLKAGFVGSDTIACILATGLHKSKVRSLLIDLGTNGEIVLGNRSGLVCCSTAAGPAFEGGHIRWGMRAAPGAVERVKIDPVTYDVKVKAICDQRPVGLCGSGIISAVAEMIRAGIVLGRGNFNEDIQSSRLRQGEDGWEYVLAWAPETATEHDIVVTQKDVSELQMAKSAVHAGATLLMELFGGEQIQRILLAGACGNYVDPLDACTVDLFPCCRTAEIFGVGNAAGDGSCLALLDRHKRKEAERLARSTLYQELAATPRFQELFVSGMFFTSARDWEDDF